MLKQILFGAGVWLGVFLLTSIILIIPGAAIIQQILTIVVLGLVGFFVATYFFKEIFGNINLGIRLGVIWALVIIVLDWIIVGVANLASQSGGSFSDAYSSWYWYVALIALVAGVVLAGKKTNNTQTVGSSVFPQSNNQ